MRYISPLKFFPEYSRAMYLSRSPTFVYIYPYFTAENAATNISMSWARSFI